MVSGRGPRGSHRAKEIETTRWRLVVEIAEQIESVGRGRGQPNRRREENLAKMRGKIRAASPHGVVTRNDSLLWSRCHCSLLSSLCSRFSLLASRLVAFVALGQRSPPCSIRTLRILNSKLQNMLSGRYKSKLGKGMYIHIYIPRRTKEKEGERGLLLAVSRFHGDRGALDRLAATSQTQNKERREPRVTNPTRRSLTGRENSMRVCKPSKWTGRPRWKASI